MAGKVWLIVVLLTVSLLISACGGETTEPPAPAPTEAPTSTPAQPATPVPTADLESVVRRVLAEVRAAETPPPTPESEPTVDYEALTFEVTERVLATLEARETSTPEPTPDPTPTPTPAPTPEPTPTLPEVVRATQNSILRITAAGDDGQLLATGVVVRADAATGEVFALTGLSRVVGVTGLEASTGSGAKYEAVIHASDEKRDLALLRICCQGESVPVTFGDALTLPMGNELVALQYGLQPGAGIVVTRGVLSSIRFDATGERWLIQTDAAASGETGGALITPDGRLVGLIAGSEAGFTDAISEVTLSEALDTLR